MLSLLKFALFFFLYIRIILTLPLIKFILIGKPINNGYKALIFDVKFLEKHMEQRNHVCRISYTVEGKIILLCINV